MDDRELTIPDKPTQEIAPGIKQLSVRMHSHEHSMLMAILKRDNMSFQKLYTYIVTGYLNADPRVLSFVKEMRELETVPKDIRDKHVLSWRERNKIFDEIASDKKESNNGP